MTARFVVGDTRAVTATLPDGSVDFLMTSPPFLALRSYLPADHPDKVLEIGSEATPAEFIDVLLELTAEWRRILAPHGSIVVELGDTYAGSGGAGSDYGEDGWREGQPAFRANRGGRTTTSADLAGRGENVGGHHMGGGGWPRNKSLTLIPEAYHFALAYGINPHTGQASPAGCWQIRNKIRRCSPNPPVGALGKKWRPATSELVVACPDDDRRYWDDVATRTDWNPNTVWNKYDPRNYEARPEGTGRRDGGQNNTSGMNPAGAPLLDWWKITTTGYPGAHYATWPPELCEAPIEAMCPRRVCTTCGEPSRRETKDTSAFEVQPLLAAHIKERREALGITSAEINGWFGYKEIAKNWERTDKFGAAIPNANDWPILKQRLGLSDEFDDAVLGERRWTESLIEYEADGRTLSRDDYRNDYGRGGHAETPGQIKANRIAPEEWTSCGCPGTDGIRLDGYHTGGGWRPGVVFDPFAGTGTTLAVATGHGRDAIGIDLDERNADLALDRVGPLLLTVEHLDPDAPRYDGTGVHNATGRTGLGARFRPGYLVRDGRKTAQKHTYGEPA